MRDQTELVVALITENNGEIVGKTRLQKTVYLLDACGLNSGFEFEYHNFGPFSSDLALETDAAISLGFIESNIGYGFHRVPYTVFKIKDDAPEEAVAPLKIPGAQKKLEFLEQHSAIVLELASTLHYLQKKIGDRGELEHRVRRLKPLKATPERLAKSWALLEGLGIEMA